MSPIPLTNKNAGHVLVSGALDFFQDIREDFEIIDGAMLACIEENESRGGHPRDFVGVHPLAGPLRQLETAVLNLTSQFFDLLGN